MSEEMKLIRALCEALGFEVEKELDYKEESMLDVSFNSMNSNYGNGLNHWHQYSGREFVSAGLGQGYARDSKGERITRLINPITSYKLTKRV